MRQDAIRLDDELNEINDALNAMDEQTAMIRAQTEDMVAAQKPGEESPVPAAAAQQDETGASPDLAERSPTAQPVPIYSSQVDEDVARADVDSIRRADIEDEV